MARHGLHQRAPQASKSDIPAGFPDQIHSPSTLGVETTAIEFATPASALTTVTKTTEGIQSVTGGVGFITTTGLVVATITDSAGLASLTAAEAQSSSSTSRLSSGSAAATSSAAEKSSSNLSTLIPAIVVPVVVVLLALFGLFWFFMRRRAHREVKNADFVMAGKGEKLNSRTNSSRSAATGDIGTEKSAHMAVISELKPPPSFHTSRPKYSMDGIGVARPLTPKEGAGASSPRRPQNDRYNGGPREQRSYQNFSAPRPNTARDRGPPPSQSQSRSRSNSSPNKRGPPPSAFDRSRGPAPGHPSPEFRGAPSPVPRSGHGPSPVANSGAFPSARGLPSNPRPAPAPPRMREPSPTMGHNARAAAPPSLGAVPPGAYNGASSISQYSPIVKETPTVPSGSITPIGLATTTPPKPRSSDGTWAPPPIKTNHLSPNDTTRSVSPTSPSGNILTEENMRIARLANSSRLGFANTSAASASANNTLNQAGGSQQKPSHLDAKASAPGQSPATTSNPSPKLPPPATRSQLIPLDFPLDEHKAPINYFATNHSRTSSMKSASSYALTLGQLHTANLSKDNLSLSSKHHGPSKLKEDDNASVVSDLDNYEDIDAKSDVSSLNEFERFEFESRNGSQRGSGSVRGLGFNTSAGGYNSPVGSRQGYNSPAGFR